MSLVIILLWSNFLSVVLHYKICMWDCDNWKFLKDFTAYKKQHVYFYSVKHPTFKTWYAIRLFYHFYSAKNETYHFYCIYSRNYKYKGLGKISVNFLILPGKNKVVWTHTCCSKHWRKATPDNINDDKKS